MIYRVRYTDEAGACEGYKFFRSQLEAQAAARAWCRDSGGDADVVALRTPRSKNAVIALLNTVAVHNDNG
jgi:hypothetical protein